MADVPTTRETFKQYCKNALGEPVVTLNLDDVQVEQRIDEALEYWRTFHHDATTRIYLQHQVTANNIADGYISTAGNDVKEVIRVLPVKSSSGGGNINMFDFNYQWRLNDFTSFYTATAHLDYYLLQRQLSMIDIMYNGEPQITWSEHMDRLYIHMDWDQNLTAGDYLIIECKVWVDPDTWTSVWSDRMLQKYATALIKRQWGNNLKIYGGSVLLGGIEISGQTIYDEAMQEIEQIEQSIRSEFEEPPHFIVG